MLTKMYWNAVGRRATRRYFKHRKETIEMLAWIREIRMGVAIA